MQTRTPQSTDEIMSDQKTPDEKTAETIDALGAPAEDNAAGTADSAAQAQVVEPDPFKVLENFRAENADLKDKLLRTLAEMENLRRRTEKEVADARAFGVTSFARDMLTFADNLRRAAESVPVDVRERAEAAVKSLIEGLDLTERDFLSRLARYGVKKLEPLGGKFDPNLHEALFEIPDESVPHGTVVQVVEGGYSIGERVLRPAKVGISRGGPKGGAN
jgi:molecular chaperone GrpE